MADWFDKIYKLSKKALVTGAIDYATTVFVYYNITEDRAVL